MSDLTPVGAPSEPLPVDPKTPEMPVDVVAEVVTSGDVWFAHNGSEWHVTVGSAGWEHLVSEGATPIDGPTSSKK